MAWSDTEGNKEPQFVKVYLDDLAKLKSLSRTERNVLDRLLVYVKYRSNLLMLSAEDRKKIAVYADTTPANLSNILTKFVKLDILAREANNVYYLNPMLAYKGKVGERAQLIITYNELGQRESIKIVKEEDAK